MAATSPLTTISTLGTSDPALMNPTGEPTTSSEASEEEAAGAPEEEAQEEAQEEEEETEVLDDTSEAEPKANLFDVARGIASSKPRLVTQVRMLQDRLRVADGKRRVAEQLLAKATQEFEDERKEARTELENSEAESWKLRERLEKFQGQSSDEKQEAVRQGVQAELETIGVPADELPESESEPPKTEGDLWETYNKLPIEEQAAFYQENREKMNPWE